MTEYGSWLDDRLVGAPEALVTAVQRAASREQRGGQAGGAGTELREHAERLLARAVTGKASRETAITLLAADALMTLACQWTAEHEPERLRD